MGLSALKLEREVWLDLRLSNAKGRFDGSLNDQADSRPIFYLGPKSGCTTIDEGRRIVRLPIWSVSRCSRSFEDLVETLIDVMTAIQGDGPYQLCGYCIAGYVALEMARRLSNRGHEIGLLALVECAAPQDRFRFLVIRKIGVFASRAYQSLVNLRDLASRRHLRIGHRRVGPTLSSEHIDILDEKMSAFFRDLKRGKVEYSGSVLWLYTPGSILRHFSTKGWRNCICGPITTRVIPGDSEDLLTNSEFEAMLHGMATTSEPIGPADQTRDHRLFDRGLAQPGVVTDRLNP